MMYDVEFDWAIAVGILLGLSLFLTYISEEKMSILTIFIYMSIVCAFIVSTGILPLWLEVLFLLVVVVLTAMNKKKGSEQVIVD